MPFAETLLIGVALLHVLGFAWLIGNRSRVDLVAGYDGELPPEREAELATDVRTILLAVAATLGVLLVDAWTGAVPRAGSLVAVVTVGAVSWLLWKWNVRRDTTTAG